MERSVNFSWVSSGSPGQSMEEVAELERQWSAKLHSFAGSWVRENNFSGVQKIAAKRREGYVANSQLRGGSVKSVAYDRMFERGKMDAYLVGAAGVKLDFQQSCGVDTKQGAPVSASFA